MSKDNIYEVPDFIFDSLVNERRTMPIDVFRSKYMGLLSHEAGNAPVALWMEDIHVRSPFVEVDVIDGNGKVLFTVPPLLDNSLPIFQNLQGTAAVEAINQIEMHYAASPIAGRNYVEALARQTSVGAVNPRYIAMWNNIRKFFKLPPIEKTQHVEKVEGKTERKMTPPATRYKGL